MHGRPVDNDVESILIRRYILFVFLRQYEPNLIRPCRHLLSMSIDRLRRKGTVYLGIPVQFI